MSEKLRSILTIALRPETGDGEATAALGAARRLVAKDGLTNVFGETRVETKTKSVYKDRDYNRVDFGAGPFAALELRVRMLGKAAPTTGGTARE